VGRLYDDNFTSLRRLAFALVGEAAVAEEIAQEAFVRLYASWRRLDRLEHAPSFLRKIVLNLCRSRGRRIAAGRRIEPLLRGPSSVDQPDVALRLDIWTALGSLPQRQRTCMVLRYLEDLPEAEVADLLGCSLGTVKSQLHRARQKLGPLLREEGRR
jgi:RNA polymerase sigma-70 factor (sigma-E family)